VNVIQKNNEVIDIGRKNILLLWARADLLSGNNCGKCTLMKQKLHVVCVCTLM